MRNHQDMTQIQTLSKGLGPVDDMALIYETTFADDSYDPDIDSLHIGTMQFGYSLANNPKPECYLLENKALLSVRLPPKPATGTLSDVTAGLLFAPPLRFDTHKPFMLVGTYVAPVGPQDGVWAVGILARTGDLYETDQDLAVVATLQFNNPRDPPGAARLNVPGTGQYSVLPQVLTNSILKGNNGPPDGFHLGLSIDRSSNKGSAFLNAGGQYHPINSFTLPHFLAGAPEEITAVGTQIANSTFFANRTGYDETAYVLVEGFQIYATV